MNSNEVTLPEAQQLELYKAIFELSLNDSEPELTGISKSIFTLIRPQIIANNQRFKNGSKAKSKRNGSETEAKMKQDKSETEANKNKNKNKLLKSKYFMMVVPSWSTVCNDRIENKVRA